MSEEVLDSAEVEDLQAEDEELAGDVTDPESDAESESQGEDPDYTGEAEDEEEDEVEGEEGVTNAHLIVERTGANQRALRVIEKHDVLKRELKRTPPHRLPRVGR